MPREPELGMRPGRGCREGVECHEGATRVSQGCGAVAMGSWCCLHPAQELLRGNEL